MDISGGDCGGDVDWRRAVLWWDGAACVELLDRAARRIFRLAKT